MHAEWDSIGNQVGIGRCYFDKWWTENNGSAIAKLRRWNDPSLAADVEVGRLTLSAAKRLGRQQCVQVAREQALRSLEALRAPAVVILVESEVGWGHFALKCTCGARRGRPSYFHRDSTKTFTFRCPVCGEHFSFGEDLQFSHAGWAPLLDWKQADYELGQGTMELDLQQIARRVAKKVRPTDKFRGRQE